jgi:calcineurin-like phosphoesterase family protein
VNHYISDLHLWHTNILRHCRRPFASVEQMNDELVTALLEAEAAGAKLYHLGDLTLRPLALESTSGLEYPELHVHVSGNHDKTSSKNPEVQRQYARFFGTIVGTEKTWLQNTLLVDDQLAGRSVRVLLSHAPMQDLKGAHFNLYGHVHNSHLHDPSRMAEYYPWLAASRSPKHFNVGVEMIDYRPATLEQLVRWREAGRYLW